VICCNQKLCDDFCQLFTVILNPLNLKINISFCFIIKIKVGMVAAIELRAEKAYIKTYIQSLGKRL
jgi:hypothetical protein